MGAIGKWIFVIAMPVAAMTACAQGSAGAYGQGGGGGMGGGFGGGGLGGRLGDTDADRKDARPDDDANSRMWQTRTAILTPGDRVEYKFNLKDNEAIFAGVTSDAFDPALTMEDSKGVVLAKNDDREEGDQSPFLIFRAPKEGDYVLKVVSYRSAAGGKFKIKIRKVRYQLIELGKMRYERIPSIPETPEFGGETNHAMLCLTGMKKGIFLDLRPVFANRLGQRSLITAAGLVGPTGVPESDFDAVATTMSPIGMSPIVKLKQDGDIFLEFVTDIREGIETDFQEVTVIAGSRTMDEKFELAPGDAKVVEYPVSPGNLVRTTIHSTSTMQVLRAPAGAEAHRWNDEDPAVYASPSIHAFSAKPWSDKDVVRIFHGEGKVYLAIRASGPAKQEVRVQNTEVLPEWKSGTELNQSLAIGESQFWILSAKKSDLIRVAASSPQMRLRLDIIRMNGVLANSLMSPTGSSIGDDLYFPEAGTFLIRLCCVGHGGSGSYKLSRTVLEPKPVALGSMQTINLDGGNFGLFGFELEKGKRYEVIMNRSARVDLLDEEGQFLQSQNIFLDSVNISYFVPVRSGKHRLWIRGESGERRFKVQATVPPRLGG